MKKGTHTLRLTRLAAACLAASLLLGAPAPRAQEKPAAGEADPVAAWLAANAVPLRGVEPGRGFEDLQPLKQMLGGARVVGIGEMTHGSHEFFRFKHRMVEFLVREMGFTVFALEAGYGATQKINDYVLYGKGDGARALAGQGLWVWDTNELTDLVEWMRAYNRTAPEAARVKFLGFDIQNNEPSMDALLAYLRRVAPERVAPAEAAFKPLRPSVPYQQNIEYNAVGAEQKAQTLARLRELVEFLTQNEARFARRTSADEFADALQHARVLAQFADAYSGGQTRDFYMAENIKWLVGREKPTARVVVSAHNDHVGLRKEDMGFYLRQAFGDKYYALGVGFNQGAFQASELTDDAIGPVTEFSVGPAIEGSVEWELARTGMKTFVVGFRQTPADERAARWLTDPHPMRSIGLGFYRQRRERLIRVRPKETFDGMAFIESTTRARPNPTGVREGWIKFGDGAGQKSRTP